MRATRNAVDAFLTHCNSKVEGNEAHAMANLQLISQQPTGCNTVPPVPWQIQSVEAPAASAQLPASLAAPQLLLPPSQPSTPPPPAHHTVSAKTFGKITLLSCT